MQRQDAADAPSGLRLELLGPFSLSRDGQPLALPTSRKLRALFAYLALAPRPQGRSHLCELLWETPKDPRGELRWCLSRIRHAIDLPTRHRVITEDDTIALDLAGCRVDALEIAQATQAGLDTLTLERQQTLATLYRGDFLEGLDIDDSPTFGSWLTAQRRRLRGSRIALLEQLANRLPAEQAHAALEAWLQLAPFDRRAHQRLLTMLAQGGHMREGEEHLAAAAAQFEAEGLDWTPIREAWRAARAEAERAPPGRVDIALPSPRLDEAQGRTASRRAAIAVMPFADESAAPREHGGAADALAHDVTTRLSKLRSMFVIAQGSAFALHERRIGPEQAGRMLNVDYVLSGSLHRLGNRFRVAVELTETRSARIIWSEILNYPLDDAFLVLDEIGNKIVASVAGEIESIERERAILRPPNSLDAWEAHHRGLWLMYRFTRTDNEQAQHFFKTAVRLDPSFSRAYAGLSFTHFQSAFQGWATRQQEIERAFESAGKSLMADDRDPAAHWSMGRALWLRGHNSQAVAELQRAIDLSPNFAMGHYALAFVQAQTGDAEAAIASSRYSQNLSPFDPLLFAILGARALALVRLGRYEEAAQWALKSASRPNAHAHIHAIAAYTLALTGALDQAREKMAAVRRVLPNYSVNDFLDSFHFEQDGETLFRRAAEHTGMA